MSFRSAIDAIVVPSLNVLDWITELPTLTGTSRIMPVIVERICVLLSSALRLAMPFWTISRLSLAFCISSSAFERVVWLVSNSSFEITPEPYSSFTRSKSRRV